MKRWTLGLAGACAIVSACTPNAVDPGGLGSIAITITGLEAGVEAAVTVTGPGNFLAAVTASRTLDDLVPGTYVVDATGVSNAGGDLFASDQSQQQIVIDGDASIPVAIVYALASGRISLEVDGLPPGNAPDILIEGPAGFSRRVTAPGMHTGLAPGTYVITPQDVLTTGAIYADDGADTVSVSVSQTPETVGVTYQLASGDLIIEVNGPTGDATPTLTVSGPNDYTTAVAPGDTLHGIRAGRYTIQGDTISGTDHTYAPADSAEAQVEVGGETTAVLAYEQITGSLAVTVNGLPPSADADITVSGPQGYSITVTTTDSLHGLEPGTYTVDAQAVADNGDAYEPTPTTQAAAVSAAASANAIVTYTNTGPIGFNLTIDGMYVVQSTQRYDGTVPLVAGRDGYLRVFGTANTTNVEAPAIRVWWYDGPTVIDSATIPAPTVGVPTSADESQLSSSWNLPLPAGVIIPTLRIRAEIDPGDLVAEADETDNRFPLDGQPAILDVRSQPELLVRFVPVLQSVTGETGRVDAGNADDFLDETERMFPVASIDADVRAPYTTNAPVLQSNNGNNAWGTILSEMRTLRNMESNDRYYYGVVRVSYGSGVAGIGYRPGIASVGWDYLPSGSGVMAHELGHNLDRRHAPCGNPAGPDPSYPYVGASIGVWGMDVAATTLKSPSQQKDLMSYCGPEWISDYTYEAIMERHALVAAPAYAYQDAPRPGVLIWGRIRDGTIVLEPAFGVDAVPALPSGSGPYRLEAIDATGGTIISSAFEGEEVADLPGGPERHFSFVIPMSAATELGAIRIRGGGVDVVREASPTTGPGSAALTAVDDRRAMINWDGSRYPMALVRDPSTGGILSFARGGSTRIVTDARTVHVTLSDGVRSVVIGTVRAR